MSRKVAIEYMVPVLCWVDIDESTIERVTMHAELIHFTGTLINEDGSSFDDAPSLEVAMQVADSTDWPVWEMDY
jgi:hypothetical protein